jgi:hypothetical protein
VLGRKSATGSPLSARGALFLGRRGEREVSKVMPFSILYPVDSFITVITEIKEV